MPDELGPVDTTTTTTDDTVLAPDPVVVRRAAGLSAAIGAGASAVAIAYLWRASQTMTVTDWALCGVMTVIAAVYLVTFVDSRSPLLVADELGVRIRLGHEWRGLPWDAVSTVRLHPRRGLLRDGKLVFSPSSLGRALDGLEPRAKRQAALNQKMYGAALAVPVGITTRISTGGERGVVDQLAVLAQGRVDVVEVVAPARPTVEAENDTARETDTQATSATPATSVASGTSVDGVDEPRDLVDRPVQQDEPAFLGGQLEQAEAGASLNPDVMPDGDPARRTLLGRIGTIVSRVAKGRAHDVDAGAAAEMPLEHAAVATGPGLDAERDPAGDSAGDPAGDSAGEPTVEVNVGADGRGAIALRSTRPGNRSEVTRDLPMTLGSSTMGNAALAGDPAGQDRGEALPESRALRRPGSVDLEFEPVVGDRVRPISTMGDPVEPLVIDDFVTEPAYDPVIGPELTAARTRLGLSVDELSDRTRIRPHVIESIEVDDFAPCGGDFYVRGHLRTLARVLGKDPAPLLEVFEERYATAPINARRVFEAELATGMTGSMRSTIGGPNWGLLVGVVLTLVLVWGVARLFSEPPAELQSPAPVLNGSAEVEPAPPAEKRSSVAEAKPLPVMLVAAHGDSQVVVRNADGRIVFSGELVLGEKKRLQVVPPVRVMAKDGGAVEVVVRKKDRGVMGVAGEPGRRTFR